MVRRSAPTHVTADRFFPVRVRVVVPPSGFGNQLEAMHCWLNMHAGRGNYWIGGETNPGTHDAALFYFYFNDVEIARAFVHRFACGVMLLRGREGERPV